jgi:hypothetical protein
MMSPKPNALNGSPPAALPAVAQRVAAEVDDAPLLRVGQHLVGGADLGEPLLRPDVRVDVRVQLARESRYARLISSGPASGVTPRIP